MNTRKLLSLTFFATLVCQSNLSVAQTVHSESGISLPSSVDDMKISRRDKGEFGEFAQGFDYKNDADRIEVNIFKATYPNPSVWFPNAQDHLTKLLRPGGPKKYNDPSIVAVGSTSPNAIRQTYQFSKHYKSSALAVVGFGDWLAFIFSTSKSLSPIEQKNRLDNILSRITVDRTVDGAGPIIIMDHCQESIEIGPQTEENAEFASPVSFEMSVLGGLAAQLSNADATGASHDGLTNSPKDYCREYSPTKKTSWYRRKSHDLLQTWITPVSITGWSIQGMLVPSPTDEDNENLIGALVVNNFQQSSVAGLTLDHPHPVYTQLLAMRALLESPKIASVQHKTATIRLVDQEE